MRSEMHWLIDLHAVMDRREREQGSGISKEIGNLHLVDGERAEANGRQILVR